MTDHNAMTRRIANANRAITAYEGAAFPDAPSLLPGDPTYINAVLGALLCDLEHYADLHGIDFAAASATGRAAHDDEVAEQARYQVGDQVRLRRTGGECGTITGLKAEPGSEPTYLVEIPGVPYLVAEPALRLEPAPPFPRVTTQLGEATRADQAEKTLIKLVARNRGLDPAAEAALRADCTRLVDALSTWSGTSQRELLHELGTGLAERITGRPARRTSGTRQEPDQPNPAAQAQPVRHAEAAHLASLDFPNDIADGVPSDGVSGPAPRSAGPKQTSHSRPCPEPSHAL
ncbi:hypothetical protein J4573_08570 [Actinomadura barringtoniae]|uniref:Uncharacterized protein n=1 Tax=Actinomadura barringtoniae TaxID=1427535 RepID=A0A939P8A2_9ACTN|nr:hypothetical protein [Actinomadura barringtoniae]MBO2447137.1 hypothetical protein [Actinomadura barringtoniae]